LPTALSPVSGNARLGAGRQLYFALRCSRAISAHQFTDTEQDVLYKGFPGRATRIHASVRQLAGGSSSVPSTSTMPPDSS